MPPREGIYGMLAEFNTPSELVEATRFVRFLPMIPMSEIRMMLPQTKVDRTGASADEISAEVV